MRGIINNWNSVKIVIIAGPRAQESQIMFTSKICFRNVIPCYINDRVVKKKCTQIVIIAGPIVEESQIIFSLKICFINVILAISMVKKSQRNRNHLTAIIARDHK